MFRPRTALLFFLLLLVSAALALAGTRIAAAISDSQRVPYSTVLIGALLIAGAICLRQFITRRRHHAP